MLLWTLAFGRDIRNEVHKVSQKVSIAKQYKKRSPAAEIWRNYKKNPGAIIGLVVIVAMILLAFAANFFICYDTHVVRHVVGNRLQRPSLQHPFGTDQFGRDIFLRILWGARYSLSIGIVATAVSFAIGGVLGIVSGYFGGWFEEVVMRVCDVFSSIPAILLAITISTAFGAGMFVLMIAVGVVTVPAFARVARAAVMTVRDQEFIEAARAIGATRSHIMFTHILPNSLAPIMVQVTMRVGSAIITASSLSFIGLGVPLPAPEWGSMLAESRAFMRDHNYLTIFPGLAIVVAVLAVNLIGDGLRDAMDPKLKR